eukprot:29380-Pelagococcus_subviridis.AAC.5
MAPQKKDVINQHARTNTPRTSRPPPLLQYRAKLDSSSPPTSIVIVVRPPSRVGRLTLAARGGRSWRRRTDRSAFRSATTTPGSCGPRRSTTGCGRGIASSARSSAACPGLGSKIPCTVSPRRVGHAVRRARRSRGRGDRGGTRAAAARGEETDRREQRLGRQAQGRFPQSEASEDDKEPRVGRGRGVGARPEHVVRGDPTARALGRAGRRRRGAGRVVPGVELPADGRAAAPVRGVFRSARARVDDDRGGQVRVGLPRVPGGTDGVPRVFHREGVRRRRADARARAQRGESDVARGEEKLGAGAAAAAARDEGFVRHRDAGHRAEQGRTRRARGLTTDDVPSRRSALASAFASASAVRTKRRVA